MPELGTFVCVNSLSGRWRRAAGPTILSDDFMAGDNRAVSKVRTIHAAAEPTAPSALVGAFYEDALRELSKLGLPFLFGGTTDDTSLLVVA
jgi:hypothetical protein